jgi:pimeloyl-ACP methyl ester carboxylesterase
VAGYDAINTNPVVAAQSALKSLRGRKPLAAVPAIAIGASLGSKAASDWFAADSAVSALALIVPGGGSGACEAFIKAGSRPVMLIQAQNDEVVGPEANQFRECLPSTANYLMLPSAGHRFPASLVSDEIRKWLDSVLRKQPVK